MKIYSLVLQTHPEECLPANSLLATQAGTRYDCFGPRIEGHAPCSSCHIFAPASVKMDKMPLPL
jgi:hypothetical protein